MSELTLQAMTRTASGRKLKALRQEKKIPAILYGKNKNVSVSVPHIAFEKLYKQAGESTLVNLVVDEKDQSKVIIQDVQRDPVSDGILHVDFYQVQMDEKLKTNIALHFIGTAPAEKTFGGVIVKSKNELTVECYPQDLTDKFDVDLSVLEKMEDVIKVKDLKVSEKITILDDAEEIIASVAEPRSEAEIASLNEAVQEDVAKVEVVEKPKKEEDSEESEGKK